MFPFRPWPICGLVAGVLCLLLGRLPGAEPTVESLRFKLSAERQAVDVPLTELHAQYTKALERLKDKVTKDGDLEKRLKIDGELGYLAGKSDTRPECGDFAALAKLRGIHDTRHAELTAEANTRREKLLLDYSAAFEQLQKSLTVADRIAEALEARNAAVSLQAELERLRKSRGEGKQDGTPSKIAASPELVWKAPFEGVMGEHTGASVEFTGSGVAGVFGAVVVDNRLPRNFTVRGQILVEGAWPGVVIGYDSKDDPFALAYPKGEGTQIETWHQKQRASIGEEPIRWERGKWDSFEIGRLDGEWTIKIGNGESTLRLPGHIRGSSFGFMTFGPGSIKVRRLSIVDK